MHTIDERGLNLHLNNFQLPDLEYGHQAFHLEVVGRPQEVDRTYEAPPLAREGYTRSPAEDDIVVCAKCDEELGGGESPLQQQVWVIKKCGHVSFIVFPSFSVVLIIG